eukprot:GDKJ01059799.1.p1 GENE.GDKJ01059799.1~~GDKJ01059799.1.p1  ORF type:complete len:830 (-),score=127.66 GDKJ01059799.1:147-2636(-)
MLTTFPAINLMVTKVIIPGKRQLHRLAIFLRDKSLEANPEIKASSKLESIAERKHIGTVPDTELLNAQLDEDYEEETFQFTKIAFKIFYNKLQISYLDAQFLWGYCPRDEATDARLELERDVFEDKRDYLFALREYDDRVEVAMKRQRMAAAAKDSERNQPPSADATPSPSTADGAQKIVIEKKPQEAKQPILNQKQPASQKKQPLSQKSPVTHKSPTIISATPDGIGAVVDDVVEGAVEVIGDVAAMVKNGLGIATANNDNDIHFEVEESPAEEATPITPPPKPTVPAAESILSPETVALDARVQTADRLSAIAITPYAAAAVAKVQREERREVENAFAKKRKQKKQAYQKTRFIDRLQNVLGMKDRSSRGKLSDREPEEKALELKPQARSPSEHSIGNPSAATASPPGEDELKEEVVLVVSNEDTDVPNLKIDADNKEATVEKAEENKKTDNEAPKEIADKQSPIHQKDKDQETSLFDRIFGKEDKTLNAEDITDTLLPTIENPLATRSNAPKEESEKEHKTDEYKESSSSGSSLSEGKEDLKRREEVASHNNSNLSNEAKGPTCESSLSDEEEDRKRKEEAAMRKQRIKFGQRQQDTKQGSKPSDMKDSEQAAGPAFSSILSASKRKDSLDESERERPTELKRRSSVRFVSGDETNADKPSQKSTPRPDDAQTTPQIIPSELNEKELMAAYYNPFLRRAIGNNKEATAMEAGEEEDGSSNDITPLTTHRSIDDDNLGNSKRSNSKNSSFGILQSSSPSSSTKADKKSSRRSSTTEHGTQFTSGSEKREVAEESKPVIHPYFLFAATEVEEDDGSKYMRMVGELNPF